MDRPGLSTEEKTYIMGGLKEDIRTDGRRKFQYRELEIQTRVIGNSMGSAKVRLGENEVIVAVSAEITQVPKEGETQVFIEFFLEFSKEVREKMKRRPEDLTNEFLFVLAKTYSSMCFDCLTVVKGERYWKLFVDIHILSAGGSAFDAISFGIKSALLTTYLPRVKMINIDGTDIEIKISEDESESWTPEFKGIPNIITLTKIGTDIVLDPTVQEEQCHTFSFIVSVSPEGKIIQIHKDGPGCLHPTTLKSFFVKVPVISKVLEQTLLNALKEEEILKSRGRNLVPTMFSCND